MSRWGEFAAEQPDLADTVRRRFEMGVNNVLATLRADGSPRVSASEVAFTADDLTLGMMPSSVKLRDVRRDPRVALHSPTVEAPTGVPWPGDAKVAGTLVETAPGSFRLALSEVVLTHIGDPADHLVVVAWHPGRGVSRRQVS